MDLSLSHLLLCCSGAVSVHLGDKLVPQEVAEGIHGKSVGVNSLKVKK